MPGGGVLVGGARAEEAFSLSHLSFPTRFKSACKRLVHKIVVWVHEVVQRLLLWVSGGAIRRRNLALVCNTNRMLSHPKVTASFLLSSPPLFPAPNPTPTSLLRVKCISSSTPSWY